MADTASEFGAAHPTGNTAAQIRAILGDDTKQAAISEMTGNTGAVRGLQDRLEAEHQGNVLWKDVQGNSKTAGRQQIDADLNADAGVRELSSLHPKRMLEAVINHVAAGATAQTRNAVKARVAQIVTETNPATVQELMAQIARTAERDQDFTRLLHRSGLIAAKVYANDFEAPTPEEPAPLEVSVWGGDPSSGMPEDEAAYRAQVAQSAAQPER